MDGCDTIEAFDRLLAQSRYLSTMTQLSDLEAEMEIQESSSSSSSEDEETSSQQTRRMRAMKTPRQSLAITLDLCESKRQELEQREATLKSRSEVFKEKLRALNEMRRAVEPTLPSLTSHRELLRRERDLRNVCINLFETERENVLTVTTHEEVNLALNENTVDAIDLPTRERLCRHINMAQLHQLQFQYQEPVFATRLSNYATIVTASGEDILFYVVIHRECIKMS